MSKVNCPLRHCSSLFVLTLIPLLVATLGCDGGPPKAPVSGKITYDGQPAPKGTVTFYPTAGGRPSVGQIASDGTYALSFQKPGDGAVLGSYTVTIESRTITEGSPGPKTYQEELEGVGSAPGKVTTEWHVPEEYASRSLSGLTAEVDDAENVIDFNLP